MWALSAFVGVGAVACGSSSSAGPGDAAPPIGDVEASGDEESGPVSVDIGVPGGPDGLDFDPLPVAGELRLQSFGQGGTHVMLGVRCIGFGSRAFITLTLTNQLTGAEITSPAPARPQLLVCRDASTCDLVPILAMAGGLTPPGVERNGLPIVIAAEVHNAAGLAATATREAVLSTADL